MTIVSYNVNGIRAAIKKGFVDWLAAEDYDVVCLQEIKAQPDQFDTVLFNQLGYYTYWMPAVRKGYSGVAILSKAKPLHVEYGCGIDEYDIEGRVLRADFHNFSVISVYMPSGSSSDVRQAFKMKWLADFKGYIGTLQSDYPNLIVSGDYNICHKPIDIHDPVRNKNSSGFLIEEREWMSSFIHSGFVDTFRILNKDPSQYSWWSYRARSREKNLGWRIDYHMATKNIEAAVANVDILSNVKHSDHCPVLLKLNLSFT